MDPRNDVHSLVERANTLEAPKVEAIVPEVRSNMKFRIQKKPDDKSEN
jgi:hypothetical protein